MMNKRSSLYTFFQKTNKDIMSCDLTTSSDKRKQDQITRITPPGSSHRKDMTMEDEGEAYDQYFPKTPVGDHNEEDFLSQRPNLKRLQQSMKLTDKDTHPFECTSQTAEKRRPFTTPKLPQPQISRFCLANAEKTPATTNNQIRSYLGNQNIAKRKPLTDQNASTAQSRKSDEKVSSTPTKKSDEKVSSTHTKKPAARASTAKTADKQARKQSAPTQDEIIDVQTLESNKLNIDDFDDATPAFARPENVRDAKGRRPNVLGYDPTTLLLPEGLLQSKELTPTMRQYWTIKSKNFDKIILFKLGKFYELFYEDALVCHRVLDLNWMGKKMHVGFPEKTLDKYVIILTNAGYKVSVVEQTETPSEMKERRKKNGGDKTIHREIVQHMSKGTYTNHYDTNYEAKYVLSVRNGCVGENPKRLALCFADVNTNIITIGFLVDDVNFTNFKTFIAQMRPSEVIYEDLELEQGVHKVLRSSVARPTFSPMNDPKHWNATTGRSELCAYFTANEGSWPVAFRRLLSNLNVYDQELVYSVIAGFCGYLRSMMILDQIMATARFEEYNPELFKKKYMVLDSQALQHLEILEVGHYSKNPVEGSLLHYVDRTSTYFGRRLLKRWLCAPLLNVDCINQRLDAIEDLQGVYSLRSRAMQRLKSLPDLERQVTKLYTYSVKQAQRIVLFEDVSLTKLREFKALMASLSEARDILQSFCEVSQQFKSNLLKDLTRLVDWKSMTKEQINNASITPDPISLIDELQQVIKWEDEGKTHIPTPREGIDPEYDAKKAEMHAVHQELGKHLSNWRDRLGCHDIIYTNSKFRYELEIPSRYVEGKKKPAELEFTSQRKDYQRFHTRQIKELVEALEEREDELKDCLTKFVYFLFDLFKKESTLWDKFVRCVAQVDCLCSLSVVSLDTERMCRPELAPLHEEGSESEVFMKIKELRHPCVCMVMGESKFIANDIILNKSKEVVLLTGPNMGGKSTLLRQVCIGAILAQIGCYVPAASCKMTVVDRIFTRLGASDNLLEGKSTFHIEMEETVNAVKMGTRNSLMVMDELGRGTSTFDGIAIAYGVLKYLLEKLQCRTFFATHYHVLLEEFRGSYSNLGYYFMDCFFDERKEKIIFKYRLREGECPRSFGIQVAQAAGLSESIVRVAKAKALEFENNFNLSENVRLNKAFYSVLETISHISMPNARVDHLDKNLARLQSFLSKVTLATNDQF